MKQAKTDTPQHFLSRFRGNADLPVRSVWLSLALLLATVAGGLAVRFAPLGLPPVVMKYGGSALWALMLYWIVSTLLPSWRIPALALLAGALATAVECFKLYNSPGLDAFRRTLPGVLLLGRVFSAWDIGAYWLAIAAGALVDRRIRRAGAQYASVSNRIDGRF